jgi:pyrrolysyl-tRNA synthetase-like protein
MSIYWTAAQSQRLCELEVDQAYQEKVFTTAEEREKEFKLLETGAIKDLKEKWLEYRHQTLVPKIEIMEKKLVKALTGIGFVQVVTPIMMNRSLLEKMTITADHQLSKQVFWIDQNKCLRPMLAPHLYYILKDLLRLWEKPVRIFEVGPCFRKESSGSEHLDEFTMLNLVEMGLKEESRMDRLHQLAALVMETAGIEDYQFVPHDSDVYGTTVDVEAGMELGSGAIGPHYLDQFWGITEAWMGIGFGLERLVMKKEGYQTIKKAGRSLAYLNGVRLNI